MCVCVCALADPGCGGTFTESEGIIISPNWPNNYAHNRQCIYIIRMPPGETVALNFTHMDLESHSVCTFDYVEVGHAYVYGCVSEIWGVSCKSYVREREPGERANKRESCVVCVNTEAG